MCGKVNGIACIENYEYQIIQKCLQRSMRIEYHAGTSVLKALIEVGITRVDVRTTPGSK